MAILRLYQSTPYPCPYLPQRTAHHHVSDINVLLTPKLYSGLIDIGFRRAGDRIHRPNCNFCSQCVSLRIPVTEFNPSKSQRRILKKNSHLKVEIVTSPDYRTYYALYQQYILHRHPETKSMHDIEETFHNFLFSRWSQTFAIEIGLTTNKLICVAICDPLTQGWSAVYTFYDTNYAEYGLGTFAILKQIELLQLQGLEYLYLGYWINDCNKMNYKSRFKPCEGFIDEQWTPING